MTTTKQFRPPGDNYWLLVALSKKYGALDDITVSTVSCKLDRLTREEFDQMYKEPGSVDSRGENDG